MSADELPSWRETTAKQSIVEFVAAVTDPDSPDFIPERDRIAVFDNDGTLWTEQPVYAQLVFALDRAAELGHPTSLEELHAGGMEALLQLVALTHAGITTDEFAAVCKSWLASARHPRFGRPYPATVYQPMVELLGLLDRSGFSCWIFSGGGTDFMRTWTADARAWCHTGIGQGSLQDHPVRPELRSPPARALGQSAACGPPSGRLPERVR